MFIKINNTKNSQLLPTIHNFRPEAELLLACVGIYEQEDRQELIERILKSEFDRKRFAVGPKAPIKTGKR